MAALDPEKTSRMLQAFEEAWRSLKEPGDVLAAEFRAPSRREHLPKSIIKLAQTGDADPARLKADAIATLFADVPRM